MRWNTALNKVEWPEGTKVPSFVQKNVPAGMCLFLAARSQTVPMRSGLGLGLGLGLGGFLAKS